MEAHSIRQQLKSQALREAVELQEEMITEAAEAVEAEATKAKLVATEEPDSGRNKHTSDEEIEVDLFKGTSPLKKRTTPTSTPTSSSTSPARKKPFNTGAQHIHKQYATQLRLFAHGYSQDLSLMNYEHNRKLRQHELRCN